MTTPRRIYRLSQAIHQRQEDIIIALDHIHDQHNLSAVIRTADAAGFGKVLWVPDFKVPSELNPEVSRGAERWVDLKVVKDLKAELKQLKEKGFKIAATHMARRAVDFRSIDWTQPWVVVFGNEHRGCEDAIAEMADENIFLPMLGFVQSLNISVAAAVTLYEIQRQRQEKGMYDKTASKEQVERLYKEWELDKNKIDINELYTRKTGDIPDMEEDYQDGRVNLKYLQKKLEAAGLSL